jgi:signal peptidase II
MRVLWVSLAIIVADQISKLAVLKTMVRSRSIPVIGDWFKLTYTENPGMAFGVAFGPPAMITILSIIATTIIIGYLYTVRRGYLPYRASLALVLGGALGNIIDRVFYGKLFYDLPFFQGRVVDFLHLDVWRGYLPDWIPLFGGTGLALFPIGNVADVAIIVGVIGIIWFQKRYHAQIAAESGAEEPDPGVGSTDAALVAVEPLPGVDEGAVQDQR